MNINNYEIFNSRIKFYEILYVFLIIIIIFLVLIGLFKLKNTTQIVFEGVVSSNILEINNLSEFDINLLLKSKKILVNKQEIKKEIIDIKENNDKYFVKIKLNDFSYSLKEEVICILKEECLYQFIINIMKGE